MMKRASALASALVLGTALGAAAQETCGGRYTVQRGDSLSLIADRLYKDVGAWTAIYRNNVDVIPSPDAIRVGQVYQMPCLNGLPTGLEGGTVFDAAAAVPQVAAAPQAKPADVTAQAAERKRQADIDAQGVDVKLLAGDDFRPFTNRFLLSSGMITDLVNRALVADNTTGQHKFYWINDRSTHLDPLLSDGMVDLAFPWKKPHCDEGDTGAICTDYLFSEPMFEMLVVLFTKKANAVSFGGESELAGMRVCSPLGFEAGGHRGGNYLTRLGARLQQPVTAEECFERLMDGSADAVAMNEFTGRVVLKDMGLDKDVELQLRRPLAIEGLHVVAHKSNPRAEALIGAVNAGLETMRESGEYLQVIDTHMSSIWAGL